MKVYLGNYVYPITTYDIASKIIFWNNIKLDEDDEYYKMEINEGLRLFGKYFRNLWT